MNGEFEDKLPFPEERMPVQVEFYTHTNLDKIVEQLIIDANFDAMKQWVETNLAPYTNMVVTEESMLAAKTFCAKLNKLVQNIDSKRKELEQQWKQPFDAFKIRCKELVDKCKDIREKIWKQIKDADETEKSEREARYRQYWNEVAGRTALYRDWKDVFEEWYCNHTTSASSVKADIDDKIAAIKADLEAIYSMQSKHEAALLAKYASGATLSETVAYRQKIEEQEIRTQERKCDERQEASPKSDDDDDGTVQQLDFRVWVTLTQARALKEYFRMSGIKYGKVEN